MAITYSGFMFEGAYDGKGNLRTVYFGEFQAWDGTQTYALFPSTEVNTLQIAALLGKKRVRIKMVTVQMTAGGPCRFGASMGTGMTKLDLFNFIGPSSIVALNEVVELSLPDVISAYNWNQFIVTNPFLVIGSTGAPSATTTTVTFCMMEVVE